MCGIVALWNRDGRPVERAAVRSAVASLARRGPDDEGYVLIDTRTGRAVPCGGDDTRVHGLPRLDDVDGDFDLALGHRRLAIVDASAAGHQPMATDDGRLWIVFNGMIYNFRELRAELEGLGHRFRSRSDTEVILHAYAQWGAECVTRFNGMWGFVLWDRAARRLLISRDRVGIKPLVYRIDDDRVVAASELGALGPLGALGDGIEPRALHHYLSLMQVPAPYTIYARVWKLRPGRNLSVARSTVTEERYWRPLPGSVPVAPDPAAASEQLEALLRDAVRLRLVADVPIGCFVSGGVDSGTIAALAAAERGSTPIATYSIAVPSDPRIDESQYSRLIAAHLRSAHTQIDLTSADFTGFLELDEFAGEPFAVSSVLGVSLIARAARSQVKVLLSGDGADELFAGYHQRHVAVDERWDHFAPGRLGRLHPARAKAAGQWVRWRGLTPATMRGLRARSLFVSDAAGRDHDAMFKRCMFNDHEKHALYTRAWATRVGDEDTIPWLCAALPPSGGDPILRRQLHDVDSLLHDEMTTKLDRGTMAWGVEGRVPLLDHRLVELAVSLPPAFRYAEGEGKWLLRRVAARVLPEAILTRPKRGFTIPVEAWLRGDQRELLYDTLSASALRRSGIFEPAAVAEMLAYFEREPHFHTAHMVFTLLCFQLWHARRATP
ncbi:MAG: asparagine synthase (glutamine-hydrolyzing) [Candidatus Binatia bacterium]